MAHAEQAARPLDPSRRGLAICVAYWSDQCTSQEAVRHEATRHLDRRGGRILNLPADLVDELGLTLVFVSHDLSVVRHVRETVAVMNDGSSVETGPVDEVWAAPQHAHTLPQAAPTLEGLL